MPQVPHTLKLGSPIEHGSQTITELVFGRKLLAGDLFDLSPNKWTNGDYATIIGRLTDQPRPLLARLDPVDFAEAMLVVEDFLSSTRTTGDSA